MTYKPLRICLVSDVALVRAAVRLACPPPNEVVERALTGVLDDRQGLSAQGVEVAAAAAEADLVLINWAPARTSLLNALCHHLRERARVPLIALCAGGGQEEMIAALAVGLDDVITFPIYLPLLQAKVAAYHRLVDGVQRAASKKPRRQVEAEVETRATDQGAQPEAQQGLSRRFDAVCADDAHETADDAHETADESIKPAAAHRAKEAAREPVAGLDEEPSPSPDASGSADAEAYLKVGPLRLDPEKFRFFVHGEEVELTPKEFDLLRYLMQHAGAVRSRDQILDEVWGLDFDTGTNMVDVYMHFLRRKLEAHGLKGMIRTIRGRGYRLDGGASSPAAPGPSNPQ